MTTNAIDLLFKKQASSDSRWSIKMDDKQILFVDDTGFDKIAIRNQTCLVFAGDAPLIEQWKLWLLSGDDVDVENIPPTTWQLGNKTLTMSICLLTLPDGIIGYDDGDAIRFLNNLARFSGTGSSWAFISWLASRCAINAIGAAKASDPYSGGMTKFLVFGDGSNNLSQNGDGSIRADKMVNDLQTRGNHMDLETKVVTPIAEHQGAKEFLGALSSANIKSMASAPIGCEVEWTDEKRAKLQAALRAAKNAGKL